MLSPDRFLYGMAWIFKLFGARYCCWSARPSVSSTLLYCSLCSVLFFEFTVPLLRLLTLLHWLFSSFVLPLAIRINACSIPLSPLSIHLLQLCLEFPVQHRHECSASGHLSSSKRCQHASLVCFFSYVVDAFFLHRGSQMDSKSLLKHGVFPVGSASSIGRDLSDPI